MKKEESLRCPICQEDHTIMHLFTECTLVLERVSGLALARCEFITTPLEK